MTRQAPAVLLEGGNPLHDANAFRRALGHFSTGVTIISAEADGELAGITANSFSSVSLDPPLILWSVKKTSTSWPIFASSKTFAVNVLAADQTELASKFARSGTDKFNGVKWTPGSRGAPVLAGLTALFECNRLFEYEGGDHLIVVGEVTNFERYERRPLLFSQGRFSSAVDITEAAGRTDGNSPAAPSATYLTLLRRAFLQRSAEFREEAAAAGFTLNESRLTYHLKRGPGGTVEDLARVALLDVASAKDSISALQGKGWVRVLPSGQLELTEEGNERNSQLSLSASHSENRKLQGFSDADLAVVHRFLGAFGGMIGNVPVYEL